MQTWTHLLLFSLLSLVLFVSVTPSCFEGKKDDENWHWFRKMKHIDGAATCHHKASVINGFRRQERYVEGSYWDGISGLGALCCLDELSHSQCYEQWFRDTKSDEARWLKCPEGSYLYGLTRGSEEGISHITGSRCCVLNQQLNHTRFCYVQEASRKWTSAWTWGTLECALGYGVAGIYKAECDHLKCIEKLYCCSSSLKAKYAPTGSSSCPSDTTESTTMEIRIRTNPPFIEDVKDPYGIP